MILLDYSQTVIGSFMAMGRGKPVVEEDLLRHTILNTIRMFRNQFTKDFGEMVICCDGKDNWRKKVFPEYKANRIKNREEDIQRLEVSSSEIVKIDQLTEGTISTV